MSAEEASPRPWSVVDPHYEDAGVEIFDAEGARVCYDLITADAALIVDAVNNADSWRKAYIKARTERNAFLLERDRLRDLVGRLAQRIQFARLADPNPGGEDPLLREAAAACKRAREEART